MGKRTTTGSSLGRRELLGAGAAATLGAVTGAPRTASAQTATWAARPAAKVDKLNFVVWTYGDIYTKIS